MKTERGAAQRPTVTCRPWARGALLFLATACLAPLHLEAQTVVSNTATATYRTVTGTDSVTSNTVGTTLVFPDLTIHKRLESHPVARIGQQVTYTIRYGNASASTIARDLVLTDTLAGPLEYVSAEPAAEVAGQVLIWRLGDVAPGDSAAVALTVRVRDTVQDTLVIRNRVSLTALNGATRTGVAAALQVVGLRSSQLVLHKAADVLEVGVGETVPYTLMLENVGTSPISDVWVFDQLPRGSRLATTSVRGSDSISLNGRALRLRIPGTIAPGATHVIRYAAAILTADGDVVANRAYATAENGFVRSEEAVAWVRIRRQWPLETRAAIGKVWLDLDEDGLQDPDEPGVEGVDVWTDDGEVTTTDRDGKFSFRNLRPGRHAFRLDQMSLAGNLHLGNGERGDEIKTVEVDGWTTPRVNFRVTRSAASVKHVYLPFSTRASARPLCESVHKHFPDGKPIVVAHFAEGSVEPQFLLDPTANRERFFGALSASAYCQVEIAGHTDPRVTPGDTSEDRAISETRARAVLDQFRRHNLLGPYVVLRGYGAEEPIAAGTDFLARQLNRRVELRLASPPQIEYRLELANGNGAPLDGISAWFEPAADSAVVLNGEAIIARSAGNTIVLPPIPAGASLSVRAWAVSSADSATIVVESGALGHRRLLTPVGDPPAWTEAATQALAVSDSLPDARNMTQHTPVHVVLVPSRPGRRDMTFALPTGWEPADRTADPENPSRPELLRDHGGQPMLRWRFDEGGAPDTVRVALRPIDGANDSSTIHVPVLRTPDDRAAEQRRALTAGPGVEVFNPTDGTVFPSDRAFIGVRGEPGAALWLFSGDSLLGQGTVRPDGIHDFIAVELSRGPHRLRVRMVNSWRQERWDSLAIHVSGPPHRLEGPNGPVQLIADGHSMRELRFRILDRWGVPVVAPTYVAVSAENAQPAGADADASSVGTQLESGRDGWIVVALKPGHDVGRGTLTVTAGEASTTVDLELLPAARPLMLTGVGRVGLGSAPDAFGAVTARGRLDRRTSVVLSYDSRLLDAGTETFGRSFDPLGESQYPILGDAAQQRISSASRYAFSARIERGFDWLALGDIPTTDFADGLNLSTYRRALTGGAVHLTTGPVVWRGFGSLTRRAVMQSQIRGAGVSGPYQLQRDIIAGTEEIALETRSRENSQRVLTSQRLIRFIDYQIDYERGTLLFKRPVPAADPHENPVFIMITYEAEGAGDQRVVGGVRASMDVRQLLGSSVDSLRIGATGIHSDEGTGSHQITGMDMRLLQSGKLDLGAEISYSDTPDSSGFAAAIDAGVRLLDGTVDLRASWMRIDSGFGNPSKTSLRGGTEELALSSAVRIGPSEFRVKHERQRFGIQGVERQRTHAGIVHQLASSVQIDAGHASDRFDNGSATDRSQAGEVRVTWAASPALTLWSEGRHQFTYEGNVVRPDHVAGGARFRINRHVSLEAQHRYVMPSLGRPYTVTNLGMRSNIGAGTQAWGSYQLAGVADGQYNAAIIGLNNQLRIGPALTLNALFERREGLNGASLTDPVRALPFLEAEEDYWSAGLGIELLPTQAPYRLSARGEYRDGDIRSTRLLTVAGDVALGQSFAVLSRQEVLRTSQQLSGDPQVSRRLSTLWGLAFRPARTDVVNALAKLQWVDETNPLGTGVLTRTGSEQRMIGTAEVIWSPRRRTEFAWRYAMRRTRADRSADLGDGQQQESWADYIGTRVNVDVAAWLAVRSEGRLLLERTSDTQRWDAAPSIVLFPVAGIEVGGGYRFGDLRDPDFAVRGGHGWFLTFGARITEQLFPTALDFWRFRF